MSENEHHEHYVLPVKFAFIVLAILLVLTVVTVAVARVDLGILNFPVAMLIATVKAAFVVMFFMGMKAEDGENRVIFFGSFVFVAIFIVLTATDLFFRPDGVYTDEVGALFTEVRAESKYKKPWNSSPELVTAGKTLYATNCASCHGAEGKGDGIALQPPPRNFTQGSGWKKGRKPTQVFSTLTKPEGLVGMPQFNTISIDDRWALVHFVLSLGPKPDKDALADYKKVGIDPAADSMGEAGKSEVLPIEFAMELMATDQ